MADDGRFGMIALLPCRQRNNVFCLFCCRFLFGSQNSLFLCKKTGNNVCLFKKIINFAEKKTVRRHIPPYNPINGGR